MSKPFCRELCAPKRDQFILFSGISFAICTFCPFVSCKLFSQSMFVIVNLSENSLSHISTWTKIVIMTVAVAIVMTSTASNSIIIHSVRVNPHMRTTTNYFIVNMACADVMFNVLSGGSVVYFPYGGFRWFPGTLGRITCFAYYNVHFMTYLCSVFSLVIITFDRFIAVTRPLSYKTLRPSNKYLLSATWVLSIGLAALFTYYFKITTIVYKGETLCITNDQSAASTTLLIGGMGGPLVIVVILCIVIGYKLWTRNVPGEGGTVSTAALRTSKRVTYMITSVVLAFIFTWGPIVVVVKLYVRYGDAFVFGIMWPLSYAMTHLSGFFNIMIYYIFSENFRNAFKAIFTSSRPAFNSPQTQNNVNAEGAEGAFTVYRTRHQVT